MRLHVSAKINCAINGPATLALCVSPAQRPDQNRLEESFATEPAVPVERFTSADGLIAYHRIFLSSPCRLRISYRAEIEVQQDDNASEPLAEHPPHELPMEFLPWTFPSRYCQSDRLRRFACAEFGRLEPGSARVEAICQWVRDRIDYVPGSTSESTSAADVIEQRQGVCRDFAHTAIACCRALTIPARFVSCYAHGLEPPDFHAVMEAYLGGRWRLFDPSGMSQLDRIARIATGRDAVDVSFASMWGEAALVDHEVVVTSDSA